MTLSEKETPACRDPASPVRIDGVMTKLTTAQTTERLLEDRLALTAYIACVTRNYHLAEDVFQEVCVKAIGQIDFFESDVHLRRWFRVSARNRAIDIIRAREGRYVGLGEEAMEALEQEWEDEDLYSRDDRGEALAKCLDSLSPRSREIVKMRYFENRSGREIADSIGAKIGSAYQAIARIHKALRECVRQQFEVSK
ncbi:RNA polymerase sigma-70 factor (ECF subfamily) [Rhodopirellula rubra]|uniref:RNA polymerase sigma-70 factor (ECF subfamily) n=1 Tax=Aporhodopirellula rubra TaxID=980271 RepID=A0A7W5H8C5_9BACT|nr:sigma-70 family RNA polymerase sigma factor [Aporhodopirellula rubra]MBB3209289.1 RNA polymerase sigma-70 factor (ECF subfamily) [Aporhodopirellula rubra]